MVSAETKVFLTSEAARELGVASGGERVGNSRDAGLVFSLRSLTYLTQKKTLGLHG